MTLYRMLLRDLGVTVERRDLLLGLAVAPLVVLALIAFCALLVAVVPAS